MSLTKIGSIGINTGIAFAGVTTITTLNGSDAILSVGGTVNFVSDVSIGGTVSIAGTLTYEDVTNVDAVGLITARNGIVVGSGITLSKDGDIFATGVTTSTTFSGSGANLTNLPAANVTGTLPAISGANLTNLTAGNLTGALPAISGANLTGIAATDNVRTGILDVAGISTFRNTVNIGAAVTISESGIEATGVGITVANINGTQIGGRRNLIMNGAMNVAQRSTSETGLGASAGYFTLDRYRTTFSNTTGRLTMAQVADVHDGFANAMKFTCTTADTSIASDEYFILQHKFEGQDVQLLKKGSSYAEEFTVSFYVKGNASATYVVEMYDLDNNRQVGKTFSVTTSWTRVVLTFPADTTGAFDNDNAASLQLGIWLHAGSNYTSGTLATSWVSNVSAQRAGGITSFFDSTDRTFFLTGLQLEVGSQATPFEHRSYQEELHLCKRYYQQYPEGPHADNYICVPSAIMACNNTTTAYYCPTLNPTMRSSPSFSTSGNFRMNGTASVNNVAVTGIGVYHNGAATPFQYATVASGLTAGQAVALSVNNDATAYIAYSSEL